MKIKIYKKLQNKTKKIKNEKKKLDWQWCLMGIYLHRSIKNPEIMNIPIRKISNSINTFLKLEKKGKLLIFNKK